MMTELAKTVLANEEARFHARHRRNPLDIPADVIRAIRASKDHPKMIAAEFGVSRQYVGQVRLGRARKDVK